MLAFGYTLSPFKSLPHYFGLFQNDSEFQNFWQNLKKSLSHLPNKEGTTEKPLQFKMPLKSILQINKCVFVKNSVFLKTAEELKIRICII